MARPLVPIVPSDVPLFVDGRTPFVAVSPSMVNARGALLDGRTCEMSLVDPTTKAVIDGTLHGYAVGIGGGQYSRAFVPRALVQHLVSYAGRRVCLKSQVLGEPPHFTMMRVVWQTPEFPVVIDR